MLTASSNRIIPKENFMAWERWHPGVLAGDSALAGMGNHEPCPETIEAMRSRAYAAGFAEGQRAGFLAGQAEGRVEGRAVGLADAATMHQVAIAATHSLQELGNTLSAKTVALASAIAQKMLQREIDFQPDSIIPIVREALALLPEAAERARLIINVADMDVVRQYLAESPATPACTVIASPEVKRGGCRITAPCGDIDATLETRWGRLMDAIGNSIENAIENTSGNLPGESHDATTAS